MKLLPAILLLLAVPAVQAQTTLVLDPEATTIRIDGESNKDAWSVATTEISGTVTLGGAAEAPTIEGARVVVPAAMIKSGKSTIMDRLMYETLQVTEHPEIVYELVEATVAGAEGTTFRLETRGRLTLAGTTREIAMPVEVTRLPGGRLRLTGTHTLLMTDYGLKPPVAMFGALRTADEVTAHIEAVAAPAD